MKTLKDSADEMAESLRTGQDKPGGKSGTCGGCTDLRTENARLQARMEEDEDELVEIGSLMTQYVDVVDPGDLLGSLKHHFKMADGYKARAERLKEEWVAAITRIRDRAHEYGALPAEIERLADTELRAAIDAIPEEAREKERR